MGLKISPTIFDRVVEMKAKEYVQQLKRLEILIKNKQLEIIQLKEEAALHSCAGFDGVRIQKTKRNDNMQNTICDYISKEEELQKDIMLFHKKRKEILHTIEMLPVVEYDLLHKIFVQGNTLYDVANIYNKSYSWATTTQGRALKKLQKILDEKECTD